MQINREQLTELAFNNPQLALLIIQETPIMKPTAYEVRGEFVTGGNRGQELQFAFNNRVFNDVWVQRVEYTVQRPNYAPTSPLRGWFEEFNKRNPGIDIYMTLDQTDKYDTTQTPQPIENIFAPSGSTEPRGFMAWKGLVIQKTGTPILTMRLTRDLDVNEVSSEIPLIVRITFMCLELRGCHYGGISRLQALAQLRAMGIMVGAPDPA